MLSFRSLTVVICPRAVLHRGMGQGKVHPIGCLAEEIHSMSWAQTKWSPLKPVRALGTGQALICLYNCIGVSRRQCLGLEA